MKDIEALTNSAFTDPSIYIKEDLLEPLTKFVTDLCLRNYESKKEISRRDKVNEKKISYKSAQLSDIIYV